MNPEKLAQVGPVSDKSGQARMSGAERQCRHRRRLATGRAVLQIEVDLVDAVEMLIVGGLLRDWTDDRRLIQRALARQIENLCRMGQ